MSQEFSSEDEKVEQLRHPADAAVAQDPPEFGHGTPAVKRVRANDSLEDDANASETLDLNPS